MQRLYLDETPRRRARHVISENARTERAAEAMRQGDAQRLGLLLNESHVSLRDDFSVSSEALDAMVECAQDHASCYGARMTGAGFGGCAVALVDVEQTALFVEVTAQTYRTRTGHDPSVYVCRAMEGAEVL